MKRLPLPKQGNNNDDEIGHKNPYHPEIYSKQKVSEV